MNSRLAGALVALLLGWAVGHLEAQADVHAHAIARASCQNGKQSAAVTEAAAALEHDPDDLGPRVRLADALVDQGCYQEAVGVLEAGEQAHPRNNLLAGKLRDVRSLVTEQTYIEGLTQAAEVAKFQRNQLRCTRLADVTACDDALKSKPDDEQLLTARREALQAKAQEAQASANAQRAAAAEPPAAAAVEHPVALADTSLPPKKRVRPVAPASKPVNPVATTSPPPPVQRPGAGETAPIATVASLEPQETRTYSNDAPPGRTN